MTDLIERLLSFKSALAQWPGCAAAAQAKLVGEAIAEIERLTAEVKDWQQRCVNANGEIERLRTDLELDKYAIGHYKDQIAKLQAVVDAAKAIATDMRESGWSTKSNYFAMYDALAALEPDADRRKP